MFITPSFNKSLIVEQFQGNYLKFLRCNVDRGKHLMCSLFSNFLRRSVDGKYLMCFPSETSVFKFLAS